ncbi:MAG: hypothetical protein LBR34_02160, partial [Prevotella sp.]|nr:hypothetical protein [Prevotella sp.]
RFELRFIRKGTDIERVTLPQQPKTVVSTLYYDLWGRPVSKASAKGVVIRRSLYSDGTTGFAKEYVK